MKVIIQDSFSSSDGTTVVTFECLVGAGIARWKGGASLPVVGQSYHVELDVDQELEKDRNVSVSAKGSHALSYREEIVTIQGMVEQVDYDGLVCLRLSQDCLIMLEAAQGAFQPGEWLTLQVGSDTFSMTSFGL